jgi:hypothetical protein
VDGALRGGRSAAAGVVAPPLPWRAWLLLIASTVAVYANSLPNGFHYDDGSMIVTNPAVHGLDRLPSHVVSATAGNEEEQPSYRPLVMATDVLSYAWGAGYRAGKRSSHTSGS